jgi:ferrochelatase
MPFLENVTRGRNIPRERLEQVAEHYYHFGGKSPINEQNLALIGALRHELERQQIDLPVYFGNRNWHPTLPEAFTEMRKDGVERALAFFTSGFSCYSGCRQYRENIAAAQAEVVGAPRVEKLRMFYNHPGFIGPQADNLRSAWSKLDPSTSRLLFTAHSIPMSQAENCRYEAQLQESCKLICEGICGFELVYQSRSGAPHQPWLEPDVCDRIRALAAEGVKHFVVAPVGFVSDHMEVLYDLDTEAAELCTELGVGLTRLPTVGTHPQFISMIVELIKERAGYTSTKRALGQLGPSHDVCPENCCKPGVAASRPTATVAT